MASSGKKNKKGKNVKKTGRFHIEMTNDIRLFLIGCFIVGFAGMVAIFLWL